MSDFNDIESNGLNGYVFEIFCILYIFIDNIFTYLYIVFAPSVCVLDESRYS